jgi:hypothetical protein
VRIHYKRIYGQAVKRRTIFPLHWIAVDHLAAALETGSGDAGNVVVFVLNSIHGYDRRERGERKMDSREAASQTQVGSDENGDNQKGTNGTRFVWNSFRSTFNEPVKRRETVTDETTWAINRFKLVKLGWEIPSCFLQIPKIASLST